MGERYRFRGAVPIDRGEIAPRTGATAIDAAIWEGRYLVAVAGLVPVAGVGWEPDAGRPGGVRLFGAFEHPDHRGRGLVAALVELALDASATAGQAQRERAWADDADDTLPAATVVSMVASRAARAAEIMGAAAP